NAAARAARCRHGRATRGTPPVPLHPIRAASARRRHRAIARASRTGLAPDARRRRVPSASSAPGVSRSSPRAPACIAIAAAAAAGIEAEVETNAEADAAAHESRRGANPFAPHKHRTIRSLSGQARPV
ncbi:hypothetical protein LV178_21000, partial [Burkholderia mallei]|nr:hypothetical protein [Burkholderia mallei]